jgi:hypothetical protein
MSEAAIASARREWAEGHRRLLEESRDLGARERLHAQVDAVTDELRRRVGAVFTLAELVGEYGQAEAWSRRVVEEHAPAPGWLRMLSVVEASAFHLYSRGAVDYRP